MEKINHCQRTFNGMTAQQPEELHTLFAHAFNHRDLDGMLALYEPGATIIGAVGASGALGPAGAQSTGDGLKATLEPWLAAGGQMTIDTRAVIRGPDGLVVLHGAWAIAEAETAGSEPVRRGLSTEVARQQPDGTWRFVIDIPHTPV
jgi:ketosteroid isomerase-like protein